VRRRPTSSLGFSWWYRIFPAKNIMRNVLFGEDFLINRRHHGTMEIDLGEVGRGHCGKYVVFWIARFLDNFIHQQVGVKSSAGLSAIVLSPNRLLSFCSSPNFHLLALVCMCAGGDRLDEMIFIAKLDILGSLFCVPLLFVAEVSIFELCEIK
jgi:hypothetical protein